MSIAGTIILAAQAWCAAGVAVALLFLIFGLAHLDPSARNAFSFRPLILPGLILLWPLVLWRWYVIAGDREPAMLRHSPPRRAHAKVWAVLAVLIPLLFLGAVTLRLLPGPDPVPQMLTPGGQG